MSNQRPVTTASPSAINFGDAPSAPTGALVPVPPPAPQALEPIAPVTAIVVSRVSDADIDRLGEGSSGAIDTVSKRLLSAQRAGDTGAMGQKLNALISEAKGLSPQKMQNKGILGKVVGFLRGAKDSIMAEYDSVQGRIDTLVAQIDTEMGVQRGRIRDLDELYTANHTYYIQLGDAVKQGGGLIATLQGEIAAEGNAKDAFAAGRLGELRSRLGRAEKRVDDFKRTQLLCSQAAPQILQMKENALALVNTFTDIKGTTIPAWRNIFSAYLISLDQKRGAELTNSVHDATDEAIRMQADLLGQNTEEIARARQRSVVSLETLEYNQTKLIESLDKAVAIEIEGRKAREAAAPRLLELEHKLIDRFGGANG